MLPAGGVSGGGRVGRKWRENGGGGGLEHGGLAEPRVCAGTPGCQPSRLGRRPGSQRRGRGGKAGGNGPECRAFREEDSSRAPAASPGLRASRETPEERLRKSDPPGSGFASGASGHLEPQNPTHRRVSTSGGRHARPQGWARRLREEGPTLGCEPPPQPPASGQLLRAGADPSPPRRARATLGAGERRPPGTTLGTGQTSGAQLVSGVKPCREQRRVRTRPLSPGPPVVPTADSTPGQQGSAKDL